jgi:hypothetical protein
VTAPLAPLDAEAATLAGTASGWSGRIAAASAVAPQTTQKLLNLAITHASAFQRACDDNRDMRARLQDLIDRAHEEGPEGGDAASHLPGAISGYRAALERTRQLQLSPFASPLSSLGGSLDLAEAVAELPPPVVAAIETWPAHTVPVLRSLGPAAIPQLATIPPDVLIGLAVMSQSEALRTIARQPDVIACRGVVATLNGHLPSTPREFPQSAEAVAHWHAKGQRLIDEAGGTSCARLWRKSPAEIAALRTEITNCDAELVRFDANLRRVTPICSAMPPFGGAHDNLWILTEHLKKKTPTAQGAFTQFLTRLKDNEPGWDAGQEFQRVVDTAIYVYAGLQQSHAADDPTKARSGDQSRGPGPLATVPLNDAKAWGRHVNALRAMAPDARHDVANANVTQIRHTGGQITWHTTDPAKLGAAGSVASSAQRAGAG